MKPFNENRLLAPGAEHHCRGCGADFSGPFPRSWDHIFISGAGWLAHCAACCKRRAQAEAA